MSEAPDDPLFGLLTDIAECVAALAARVDAMEVSNIAHHVQVHEALATIAEIATRTYYVSKPSSALPDDVINTDVMGAMIERWPRGATISMSSHDRQLLSELDQHPDAVIDKLIARAEANTDTSNAGRIRMSAFLDILNRRKNGGPKRKAWIAMRRVGTRRSTELESVPKCRFGRVCVGFRNLKSIQSGFQPSFIWQHHHAPPDFAA